MVDIGWAAATALLHMVLVGVLLAPLMWWRARRGGCPILAPGGARSLIAAAGIYLVAHGVLSLPRVGFFAELSYNWQNKLLLFALMVLAIWLRPPVTWRDVGVARPRRGWWIPIVVAFAGMVGLNLLGGPQFATDTETFLFQAVVPGLDEELLFRGVLLLVLHRTLTGRRSMWRDEVGWEVPITCLLFGLVHGLHVVSGWELTFDPADIIVTGLLGLLLTWIRIRWASLLPAVLAHNAINTAATVANAMLGR